MGSFDRAGLCVSLPQAILTCNFRPSSVAALQSVLSVTDLFSGSSRRSSWRRSVFIFAAMVVLVFLYCSFVKTVPYSSLAGRAKIIDIYYL